MYMTQKTLLARLLTLHKSSDHIWLSWSPFACRCLTYKLILKLYDVLDTSCDACSPMQNTIAGNIHKHHPANEQVLNWQQMIWIKIVSSAICGIFILNTMSCICAIIVHDWWCNYFYYIIDNSVTFCSLWFYNEPKISNQNQNGNKKKCNVIQK